jgi:hypothetical protein
MQSCGASEQPMSVQADMSSELQSAIAAAPVAAPPTAVVSNKLSFAFCKRHGVLIQRMR